MNNKLVSIIIPIYNPGIYIKKTLDSICKQSYKNIEVLLIDDGSTDNSFDYIKNIINSDNRVFYYKKENGGVCSARNYGIKKAKGDYIFFSDDDDEIHEDTIEALVNKLGKSDGDFIKYSVDYIMQDYNDEYSINDYYLDEIELTRDQIKDYYLYLYKRGAFVFIWNGLYKRDYLLSNNIFFDDTRRYSVDDKYFNQLLFKNSNKFMLSNFVGYRHISRLGQSDATKLNLNKSKISLPPFFNLEYETARLLNVDYDIYNQIFSKNIGVLYWELSIKNANYRAKERIDAIRTIRNELVFIDNIKICKNLPIFNKIVLFLFIKKMDYLCYYSFVLFRVLTGSINNSRPSNRHK